MNIKELHPGTKEVSTTSLFKTTEGTVTSIQIAANSQLKEHITRVPALLICVTGDAIFENEKGIKQSLTTGDYIMIDPLVKHWVNAISLCNLILVR